MKVVLVAALSSDGFIARHKDELADWTTKEDKQYFVRRTKELGVMVMGRTTFETIGRALPGRRMIVLTSTPDAYSVSDVEFTSESPSQLVRRLQDEGCSGLAVCGGSQIYSQFLREGLVHEMALSVVDVKLGGGIRLCADDVEFDLNFLSSEYLSESVSAHCFAVTN